MSAMKISVPLVVLSLLVLPGPAVAEMYDAEYQACSGGNSVEIVQCLAAKTRAHDARLNASFKAAMGHVDAPQRELLRQAQRLWIQYRDANCRLYGASEGSLREIAAAECLRTMTADRAQELKGLTQS
ncbi:MAG TPA: lysozyme inhibitor LprI family protein [Rhizorhapis sp.]